MNNCACFESNTEVTIRFKFLNIRTALMQSYSSVACGVVYSHEQKNKITAKNQKINQPKQSLIQQPTVLQWPAAAITTT